MIKIKIFPVNDFRVNSFVLSDETKDCIFIDPGFHYEDELDDLYTYIKNNMLIPKLIVNTHCHFDHIIGVQVLKEKFNILFYASKHEEFFINNTLSYGQLFGFDLKKAPEIDNYLENFNQIKFGNSVLQTIFIPGHSPGSMAFYSPTNKFIIVGDVLFNRGIGRTDLPGGDYDTIICSIKDKLFTLPQETIVYPGHGPFTIIGEEKKENPFLL